VAEGERLQMKFNGKSEENRAIRNGELVTVREVLSDGRIRVKDDDGAEKTLSAKQRMFVPGYAVTSYASQGKTVDRVLVSYAASDTGNEAGIGSGRGIGIDNKVSANRNQWCVAISRGREKITVLTEDKEALRLRIEQESGNRELALSIRPMDRDGPVQGVREKNLSRKELEELHSPRLYREMTRQRESQMASIRASQKISHHPVNQPGHPSGQRRGIRP
jgi:hypothetical protein